MKVMKSVMKTYQTKSRDQSDTEMINVFHVTADAISYCDSTVY